MWLGFVVLSLITAQAMEQGKIPRIAAMGHDPVNVKLGGFKKISNGNYSVTTSYMCLKCGKHLTKAYDFDGYMSEAEPCIEAQKDNTTLIELLQRLQRFEEFNQARNTRSHSI